MACRVGAHEDSPVRVPLDRRPLGIMREIGGWVSGLGPRAQPCGEYLCRPSVGLLLALDRETDGPDEAQQFSRDRRHHVLLNLAPGQEPAVPPVQTLCAFQAMAVTSALWPACRWRSVGPIAGRCR